MLERIRTLLRNWRSLEEIEKLDDHDLADMGFSREELRELVTMPADVAERIDRMAAVFGLSPEEIRVLRAEYVELLESCAHCESVGRCVHMLDAGTARPDNVSFCPNAAIYRQKAASHQPV